MKDGFPPPSSRGQALRGKNGVVVAGSRPGLLDGKLREGLTVR